MSTINVHPRIAQRHPNITEEDVCIAVQRMIRYKQRSSGEWIAMGIDKKNRLIELVYLYDEKSDTFLVYHAMTPPSAKFSRELGIKG